jgi:hypothetical protein
MMEDKRGTRLRVPTPPATEGEEILMVAIGAANSAAFVRKKIIFFLDGEVYLLTRGFFMGAHPFVLLVYGWPLG